MTELERAIRELRLLKLHGQRNKGEWHGEDIELGDTEEFQTIELGINELTEDLENAKESYKALEEHFNNSVAYATKIQEELNGLKKDVARYIKFIENDNYGENGLDSYFVKGEYLPHESKENGYLETRGRLIEEAETLYEKLSKVGKEE